MAAINCKPIIEHANAKIAVASMTGQVLDAKILDQPQAVDAAWAQMWDVNYGEPERVGSSSYTNMNNVTTTGPMSTYPATMSVRYVVFFQITHSSTAAPVISSSPNSSPPHT